MQVLDPGGARHRVRLRRPPALQGTPLTPALVCVCTTQRTPSQAVTWCALLPQVSPEFSIRFMDEAYAQENATIQKACFSLSISPSQPKVPLGAAGWPSGALLLISVWHRHTLCMHGGSDLRCVHLHMAAMTYAARVRAAYCRSRASWWTTSGTGRGPWRAMASAHCRSRWRPSTICPSR